MASMGHEVLVDLFKNRPSLGPELLTEALGHALPSYTEARIVSIDLTQIRPAEYRADVVVLLLDGAVPIWVLIVEVQLGIDEDKRFSWPEYTTGSRAKHRCPVGLLVVAPIPTSPRGARSRSRRASPASSCVRRCWDARRCPS